jgi:hypothetical protein
MFSRGKVVSVTTKPMALDVRSFPEEGQPGGFFGAVGKMNLSVEAQPRQLKVGQAVTVTARLSGEANFSQINSPIWPDLQGFAVNENSPQTDLRIENNRVAGQKTWEKVLIVRKADAGEIGPIRLPYFDPEKKAYVDLSTEPIQLTIDSSAGDGRELVILNTGEEIEITADDFRYIVTDPGSLTNQDGRLYRGSLFWALNLAPVFLVVSATAYQRRQRRMETDGGYARRVRAPRQARKVLSEAPAKMKSESRGEFFALLSKAILDLILDRFGFSARGLVHGEVSARLIEMGVNGDLAGETSEFLLHLDNSRFAGGGDDASLAEEYNKAKDLVDRLLKT